MYVYIVKVDMCKPLCDSLGTRLITLFTEQRICPCILAQAQRCTGALVEVGYPLRRPLVAIQVKSPEPGGIWGPCMLCPPVCYVVRSYAYPSLPHSHC